MQFRLRTLLVLSAIVPPLLALLYYGPVVTVWDGGFTVCVSVVNKTGKTIDQVAAAVVSSHSYADALVAQPDAEGGWMWKPMALDANGRGEVYVKSSGHVNWFGRELSYYQQPKVAFKICFVDGSRSLFAVNTPQRGVRELLVHVPNDEKGDKSNFQNGGTPARQLTPPQSP